MNAVAGTAFLYAGVAFWHTRSPKGRGMAARSFAVFWLASGVYDLLLAAMDLGAASGAIGFEGYLAWRLASHVLAGVILGGLATYLLYLYTGNEAWLPRVAVFYAGVVAFVVAYSLQRGPVGVAVGAWRVDLAYRDPLGPAAILLVLFLLLPPVACALAYGRLASRAPTPRQRRRILLVSAALAAWFSAALLAQLSQAEAWQFATRAALGLGVSLLVVLAYADAPDGEERLRRITAEARREALRARVKDLV